MKTLIINGPKETNDSKLCVARKLAKSKGSVQEVTWAEIQSHKLTAPTRHYVDTVIVTGFTPTATSLKGVSEFILPSLPQFIFCTEGDYPIPYRADLSEFVFVNTGDKSILAFLNFLGTVHGV